ncbi:tetratricopeptide repeat protein [Paenibacillus caui]|uniref:tetratricopeptide repeat protein n=1 Tax=Paenibacillus caui TaxID=2873927 RepID=UPI001CA91747|nr:tetratricopeptide repeat protein [Paenibacillus caui]
MTKILIFTFIWWLVGNPFLAIIIFLVILYALDRRFVGIFPSLGKPLKRMRSISRLRQQISLSPHDVSSKRELARLLMERKKYREAAALLEEVLAYSEDSAEFWADFGEAAIGLGDLQEGEQRMLKALQLNDRVKYGQPYLKLAAAFKAKDSAKAIKYAEQFRRIQSSSSEAYYLLGTVYHALSQKNEARAAFTESITVYRLLPKYKKRQERGWALRSFFKRLTL